MGTNVAKIGQFAILDHWHCYSQKPFLNARCDFLIFGEPFIFYLQLSSLNLLLSQRSFCIHVPYALEWRFIDLTNGRIVCIVRLWIVVSLFVIIVNGSTRRVINVKWHQTRQYTGMVLRIVRLTFSRNYFNLFVFRGLKIYRHFGTLSGVCVAIL